jgi:hypothetical protein
MTLLYSLTVFLQHSYILWHDTLTQYISLFLTLFHSVSVTFLHSLEWCPYTISFSVSITLILEHSYHSVSVTFLHSLKWCAFTISFSVSITLILSLSYSVSTTLLNSHILFLWHYNTFSLSRPVSMTCLCSLTLFLWQCYILSHDALTDYISPFLTLSHSASMTFLHFLKGYAYTISFSVSMTLILSFTLFLSHSLTLFLLNSRTLSLCFYDILTLSHSVSMTFLHSLTLLLWHYYTLSNDALTQSLCLFLSH